MCFCLARVIVIGTRDYLNWLKSKNLIIIFLNYLPLQIRTLKICNHYILKSITARSFKLCQLIENVEWINW